MRKLRMEAEEKTREIKYLHLNVLISVPYFRYAYNFNESITNFLTHFSNIRTRFFAISSHCVTSHCPLIFLKI
jgi:hypothetical protein